MVLEIAPPATPDSLWFNLVHLSGYYSFKCAC